jgi:hypothetical protein
LQLHENLSPASLVLDGDLANILYELLVNFTERLSQRLDERLFMLGGLGKQNTHLVNMLRQLRHVRHPRLSWNHKQS